MSDKGYSVYNYIIIITFSILQLCSEKNVMSEVNPYIPNYIYSYSQDK